MSFRHFDVEEELQKLRVPPPKPPKVPNVDEALPGEAGNFSHFRCPPSSELHISPWPDRAADLITWFQARRAELSTEPFYLNRWTKVEDPAAFYAALDRDIRQGPKGYRRDSLLDDLDQLFERWAIQHEDDA
jgi:hypothetical protein